MTRQERIARAIAASGLKKGEIAAQCGVANSAVTQWISGESKSLRPENLYALARATGFRAEWLAIGEGPEQAPAFDANVALIDQPKMSFRYPVISWVSAGSWEEAVQPYPDG
ncbi:helix-turn-helix domain-containing protein, partial [Pseudomonas syringae]